MFNDLKPKLGMTKTQGNILMTQIRAQRKIYGHRHEPVFLNSHRDENKIGKRIFKQHLYQTTTLFLNPSSHRQRSHGYSPSVSQEKSTGKRTGYGRPTQVERSQSRGKRKVALNERFMNSTMQSIISFNPTRKIESSPLKFCKRRLDQSPNNQNRLSPGFHLFRNNNKDN